MDPKVGRREEERPVLPDRPYLNGFFLFLPAGIAAAIVSGGWFILPKAVRALRRFALDMNVLMTVAVIGAVLAGPAGR